MADGNAQAKIAGESKQWHKITLDFSGPRMSESEATFLDHRLDVTFEHAATGQTITVPGYFAADGRAADSGAGAGSVWRAHFNPPKEGTWTWEASFREGNNVAVAANAKAGSSAGAFDGAGGSISVGRSNKSGDDLRGKGMLEHDGDQYLNFKGSGDVFLKSGVGSPENFLAYEGFDNTPGSHDYKPHARDFDGGDPTWSGGDGKGIIGAVNYLAEQGVNSAYMMLMNVGGDGRDVWPWAATDLDDIRKNAGNGKGSFDLTVDARAFDVSKLDQWERVFEHMQEKGIVLHLFLQETENDHLLNDGDMGVERELFMREMVARFGHHNGIIWNLGEETSNSAGQLKAHSKALKALDPYDHPVALHTYPSQHDRYEDFEGSRTLDALSFQTSNPSAVPDLERYLGGAEKAGRPVAAFLDEPGTAGVGAAAKGDKGWQANHDDLRDTLWNFYMEGGSGAEWYFGYKTAGGKGGDLEVEDFRSREDLYGFAETAREFFEDLPLGRMEDADKLTSGTKGADQVRAVEGETYAVYLPSGGSATLDLKGEPGAYDVTWVDPRSGARRDGSVDEVAGGGKVSLGTAPYDGGREWTVLVEKTGGKPPEPEAPKAPKPPKAEPPKAAPPMDDDDDDDGAEFDGGSGDIHRMRDGLVVMQAEDGAFILPRASGNDTWSLERDLEGYKGDGYLLFDTDEDYFSAKAAGTAATGPLSYTFRVSGDEDDVAGRYFITLRAMKPDTDEPSDRNNDFYVAAGPADEDPAGWKKLYFSGGAERWLWGSSFDAGGKKGPATFEVDGPGDYTISVSGRSRQAGLDEIHVQKGSKSTDDGAKTSPLVAEGSRPDPKPAPKPDPTPDPKPAPKPDPEPDPKPAPTPKPTEPDDGAVAINIGSGRAFTAADGTVFDADRTGVGERYSTTAAIAGTRDDALYQTEAYGADSLSYSFATGDGTFRTTLHFAEIFPRAFDDGARAFDVAIEGKQVADDLDVHEEVGALTALTREHVVTVRDGVLDLDLVAVEENAKLSAIEIAPVSGGSGGGSGGKAPSAPPAGGAPTAANDAIVFDPADIALKGGKGSVTIETADLLANDEGAVGSIEIAGNAADGDVTLSRDGSTITYAFATKGFDGKDAFGYRVVGADGSSDLGRVYLDLTGEGSGGPAPSAPAREPVAPSGPAASVDGGFVLIDARSDAAIATLGARTVIDADAVAGRSLNVSADGPKGALSAALSLDGEVVRVENEKPFALFGDNDGDFRGGLTLGDGKTIVLGATYHAEADAGGRAIGRASATVVVEDDVLKGRAGTADVFVFDEEAMGRDTVIGFEGRDALHLTGGISAREALAAATVVGGDTVIDFGGGDVLTLRDFANLGLDDFLA